MQHSSLDSVSLSRSWVTIGVFDGVHCGHQEILKNLTAGAHKAGAPAVVLTFYPHPAVVLGKKQELKYLTLPDEKAALLEGYGVDDVITQPFTPSLALLSAADFMTWVHSRLRLSRLWVGYDFALGHGREGNAAFLSELGKRLGYETQVLGPVGSADEPISSSQIRRRIETGDVGLAAESLGRFYALSGPVVHGDGRGRTINVPTANVQVPVAKVIPANGVYATWAIVDGKRHAAVTNVGIRPTFTPDQKLASVEAHLLDYDHDLYGSHVTLEFAARLRDEMKFSSVDALVGQIRADIEKARTILK
jgi:riboflavin kinase/FMN adenylyltransferase